MGSCVFGSVNTSSTASTPAVGGWVGAVLSRMAIFWSSLMVDAGNSSVALEQAPTRLKTPTAAAPREMGALFMWSSNVWKFLPAPPADGAPSAAFFAALESLAPHGEWLAGRERAAPDRLSLVFRRPRVWGAASPA